MTQEEKELLLKDICTRLPYGVKVLANNRYISIVGGVSVFTNYIYIRLPDVDKFVALEDCRPYFRTLPSMTHEECVERIDLFGKYQPFDNSPEYVDWLNAHHFDYRGLIEKGIALEAPKDMYNIKKK